MALRNCPECAQPISDRAITCPHCGFPLDEHAAARSKGSTDGTRPTVQSATPLAAVPIGNGETPAELEEIAYRQKLLLYAILISLLSTILVFSLAFFSLSHGILAPVIWAIWLGNVPLYLWCWYKLARALRKSLPYICITSLALFLPIVALLALVAMNGSATGRLERAGIKVGLMGADLRGMQRSR